MKFHRKSVKIFLYSMLTLLGLLLLGLLIIFAPSLWRNIFTYPKMEKQRAELWTKYRQPEQYIEKKSHMGVLHSHTYWSHDSRGTLTEIMEAAKKADLEFIFLSDHARNKLDTFPRSYHGVYDGIIIEAGTESSSGVMVNPFESTVLDWNMETEQLIRHVVGRGGLVT
jgi:hypothetical protein